MTSQAAAERGGEGGAAQSTRYKKGQFPPSLGSGYYGKALADTHVLLE